MATSTDSAVTGLLSLLGGVAASQAIRVLIADKDGHKKIRAWALLVAGICIAAVGWWWPSLKESVGTRLADSIGSVATNAYVWLALVVVFILYVAAGSFVERYRNARIDHVLKSDIPAIEAILRAYVMPRRISPEQKEKIVAALAKTVPREVRIEVLENVREVGDYAADVERVIREGGWTVLGRTLVPNVREGLTVMATYSPASNLKHTSYKLTPLSILQEAFLQASVKFDGMSSGGGPASEDTITVCIGQRIRGGQPALRLIDSDLL